MARTTCSCFQHRSLLTWLRSAISEDASYNVIHPKTSLTTFFSHKYQIPKVEVSNFTRMNKTMCNCRIKFDGVETVPGIVEMPGYRVPHRATGIQFYQYRLIVDYLTNDKPQQLPEDSLPTAELCILHDIISNAVQVWERGDEHRTCPELRSMPQRR